MATPKKDPTANARATRRAIDRREAQAAKAKAARETKTLNATARHIASAKSAVSRLTAAMDRMERHPSVLATTQLRALAKDKAVPAEIRARAAAVVLKWTDRPGAAPPKKRKAK